MEQFQLTFFSFNVIQLRSKRKKEITLVYREANGNKKNVCEITWKFHEKEIIQEQTDPNLSEKQKERSKKILFILIYIQRGKQNKKKEIFQQ